MPERRSPVLPFSWRTRRWLRWVSLALVVGLSVLLLSSIGLATQEKPQPQPQPWQITGIEAALLKDSSPYVQGYALAQLVVYESKALIAALKHPREVAQQAATLLQDKQVEAEVRVHAAAALGKLGEGKAAKSAVSALVEMIKDEKLSAEVRSRAAVALGKLGEGDAAKSAVSALVEVMKDKKLSADVRGRAAEALGNLGEGDAAKSAVPALVELIKDENVDTYVQLNAAYVLGKLGEGDAAKSAVPVLVKVMKDKKLSAEVRRSTAFILVKLGEKSVVPTLVELIKDKQVEAYDRLGAAEALGSLGEKSAVPALVEVIKDEKLSADVRGRAAEALGNLGEGEAVPALVKVMKDEQVDADVRVRAAYVLGQLGEKSAVPALVKVMKDEQVDVDVQLNAAYVLGQLGEKSAVPALVKVIKDEKVEAYARLGAAEVLGSLGEKSAVPALVEMIKDEKVSAWVRGRAAAALGSISPVDLHGVGVLLENTYRVAGEDRAQWRFYAYFLSGGTDEAVTLLRWLGYPQKLPAKLSHAEGKATLEVFERAWDHTSDLPYLRDDLEKKIAAVAKMVDWQTSDILLLQRHYRNLKAAGSTDADSVQATISTLTFWQWIVNSWLTLLTHAAFWLALIFAYPQSPQIQAIFFWNPWVRNVFGLGYVTFLLTWVPFLRRKLFEPFKVSLLADAGLQYFDPQAYFPESDVKVKGSEQAQPLIQALPRIQGQTILEGDSGLGKSMFLRHLVQQSDRITVYLPAQKCDKGVLEAIQAKLHGDEIKDAKFLQNLIYSGAIDICIDGLNEVTADTRAKIAQFVESYFKGNIIMTTQPLEWLPPATAKTYILQPLQREQIEHFLLSRQSRLAPDAPLRGKEYEVVCLQYLNAMLTEQQSGEELAAIQRVLSNPMDLTILAQMLAQGKTPDLFRLQEQQYTLMAEEYQQMWKTSFPLKKFSEAVYMLRLQDEKVLPFETFEKELVCMEDERYKMVVSRQWQNADGKPEKEWYFRHDKIAEFFIVQTFLGRSSEAENRWIDHMGDPRFRGVYFLLATLLATEDAQRLREMLIQYAADTKDHTVSDTVVQILRTRSFVNA